VNIPKGVSKMTADAKVGLLLSFVFIIIIAFLIKGLPDFFGSASAQEGLTTSVDGFASGELDLSNQAEAVVKTINSMQPARQPVRLEQPSESPTQVRFRRKLPGKTVAAGAQPPKQNPGSETGKGRARSYVVQPGDNLAVIAIKVYGAQVGNKRAIVNRIFEANRQILDSPDEIAVGQKLTIPSLGPAGQKKADKRVIAATGLLGKVKKFAGKNLSALKSAVGKPTEYVVQPGDNLWKIADRFLADGSRYYEIVELNSDVIADAEDIPVGLRLRLPSR